MADINRQNGEDGDTIAERVDQAQHVKYAEDKILHVYKNLEARDLRRMSPHEVMSQLDLSATLGGVHEFEGETLTKLAKAMKYLPGSLTELEKSPLVSIVKIFGPFEFLQKGIQIADIPGVGDADGARGRIAERYQENVDTF